MKISGKNTDRDRKKSVGLEEKIGSVVLVETGIFFTPQTLAYFMDLTSITPEQKK